MLSAIFRCFNDNLDIEINPWNNIQKKPADTQSKRDFTKKEVELILSKAQDDMYTTCLIGSQTGFRMKDCCLLQWGELDLETRIIKHLVFKTTSRTKTVVRMYIFDKLLAHLTTLKRTARGAYICPDMASVYFRDRGATVSRRVQAFFRDDCGIELHSQERKGKAVESIQEELKRRR